MENLLSKIKEKKGVNLLLSEEHDNIIDFINELIEKSNDKILWINNKNGSNNCFHPNLNKVSFMLYHENLHEDNLVNNYDFIIKDSFDNEKEVSTLLKISNKNSVIIPFISNIKNLLNDINRISEPSFKIDNINNIFSIANDNSYILHDKTEIEDLCIINSF